MGGETARKPDTIDELAATLQKGDQITTDVKSRALTVTDRWTKPVGTDIRAGEEYQVVELEREETRYHLVYVPGDGVKPILYHEEEWTETNGDGGTRFEHVGKGERVYQLAIGARGLFGHGRAEAE